MARRSGLEELIYDPIGYYFAGQRGVTHRPYGGHGTHVHVADDNPYVMLSLIRWAQRHGLRVGENPYTSTVHRVHTDNSWHYRSFGRRFNGRRLGMAGDVTGTPGQMRRFFRYADRTFEHPFAPGYAKGIYMGRGRRSVKPGTGIPSALLSALSQPVRLPPVSLPSAAQTLAAMQAQAISSYSQPAYSAYAPTTSNYASQLADIRRRLLEA